MKFIINYKKPIYNNNKLIEFYLDNKYVLNYVNFNKEDGKNINKKGGDDSLNNEFTNVFDNIFDNLKLEDIIQKPMAEPKSIIDRNVTMESKEMNEKNKLKLKLSNKLNSSIIRKENIINNITLFSNMNMNNLKEIISYITGISIEKIHLEQKILKELNNKDSNKGSNKDSSKSSSKINIKQNINSKYIYENIEYEYKNKSISLVVDTTFNSTLDTIVNLDLLNESDKSIEYIDNLFIDFNLVNNRDLYRIITYNSYNRISNLLNNTINEVEIDIFNIDDFFILDNTKGTNSNRKNTSNNYEKYLQDNELLNILYYGFVEKYFPLYSLDLFRIYLENINNLDKIYEYYPILLTNKNIILSKNKLINDINLKKSK
jgi:hypothetical protein